MHMRRQRSGGDGNARGARENRKRTAGTFKRRPGLRERFARSTIIILVDAKHVQYVGAILIPTVITQIQEAYNNLQETAESFTRAAEIIKGQLRLRPQNSLWCRTVARSQLVQNARIICDDFNTSVQHAEHNRGARTWAKTRAERHDSKYTMGYILPDVE
jgi:hypothetical protein